MFNVECEDGVLWVCWNKSLTLLALIAEHWRWCCWPGSDLFFCGRNIRKSLMKSVH